VLGCPVHVLLPLLVLFYDMFERINNQSVNQWLVHRHNSGLANFFAVGADLSWPRVRGLESRCKNVSLLYMQQTTLQ